MVLLYGDVPMLSRDHRAAAGPPSRDRRRGHSPPPPSSTGRLRPRRPQNGRFARIVEERDASDAEKAITEINSGIYASTRDGLFEALGRIGTENDQGEYYLTDLIGIFRPTAGASRRSPSDADELLGVNSRAELAA